MVVLLVLRPKDMDLRQAVKVVPDTVRLLRSLAADPALPRAIRRRVVVALAWLASPIDLVPEFIPVLGYADDVVVLAWVLRSVIRQAGPEAVERHWQGSPEGLALLGRITRTDVRRHPPQGPGA